MATSSPWSGLGMALAQASSIALLLAAYAATDALLRREQAYQLPRTLAGILGFGALCLVAQRPWKGLPLGGALAWFSAGVGFVLAWNAATRDYDLVRPGPGPLTRIAVVLSACLCLLSPLAVIVTAGLLSLRFRFWQHHASFPMRVLQCLVAYLLVAPLMTLPALLPSGPVEVGQVPAWELALASGFVILLCSLFVSHYFITFLAKLLLGPRPWSWALENRLHYLPASAYSWGFARFLPWTAWRKLILGIRDIEVPLQLLVFSLEFLVIGAGMHRGIAVALAFAFAGFHLGVCAVSGLLFWDWIATDLLLGLLLIHLPTGVASAAFGWAPWLLGILVLVLFPLRHKLWMPAPLGWYDSPFTQRVHYEVTTLDGRVFALTNDFMCPHERIYGKVHGCFAVSARVMTYHLGEVWKLPLRDALVAAGPHQARLESVRREYGIEPWSQQMTLDHMAYLRAYFSQLNAGSRKYALPRGLRLLKAPGDQLFYWATLPRYDGHLPVRRVTLRYREEYFDGTELVRLEDEIILEVRIPASPEASTWDTPPELSPQALDNYLLALGRGRLMDLPKATSRYTAGDDQCGESRARDAASSTAPRAS